MKKPLTVDEIDNMIDALCGYRGEIRRGMAGWREHDDMAEKLRQWAERIESSWRED